MIRNFIVLLNVFVILIYKLIFSDGVTITQDFPEKVNPGQTFTVELTVDKGQITGFAKLQQELPAGFSAVAVETNGASFTFNDGNVKFIWMSIPKEETFKVSYKVTTPATTAGSFLLEGDFAYLEGNNKQTAKISARNLIVMGSNSEPEITMNNTESNTESETTESSDNTDNSGNGSGSPEPRQGGNQDNVQVSCERFIDKSRLESDGEIMVTIRVNKGNVAGFAKLQETMPAGFTPESVETAGSSFSFSDNHAKFLWMSLPADAELVLRYKINVKPGTEGEFIMNGDFSYLVDNETRKCPLQRESLIISPSALVNNNTTNVETETETGEQSTVQTENTQQKPLADNQNQSGLKGNKNQEPSLKANKPVQNENTVTPAGGINYKVQIAAARKQVDESYFRKKFNITDQIAAEMHEGWNKFTIGDFGEYRAAREKRNETRNRHDKLIGPFVTAYNNGERITVQEALMISGQKWVQ